MSTKRQREDSGQFRYKHGRDVVGSESRFAEFDGVAKYSGYKGIPRLVHSKNVDNLWTKLLKMTQFS